MSGSTSVSQPFNHSMPFPGNSFIYPHPTSTTYSHGMQTPSYTQLQATMPSVIPFGTPLTNTSGQGCVSPPHNLSPQVSSPPSDHRPSNGISSPTDNTASPIPAATPPALPSRRNLSTNTLLDGHKPSYGIPNTMMNGLSHTTVNSMPPTAVNGMSTTAINGYPVPPIWQTPSAPVSLFSTPPYTNHTQLSYPTSDYGSASVASTAPVHFPTLPLWNNYAPAPVTPVAQMHKLSYDTPRYKLTPERAGPLIRWFDNHKDHPYPSRQDKITLCHETQLTFTQVSTWFANARRRMKKANQEEEEKGSGSEDAAAQASGSESESDAEGPEKQHTQ